MKAWNEYFFPMFYLIEEMICCNFLMTLLHCLVEYHFDFNFENLFRALETISRIYQYVQSGGLALLYLEDH